MPILLPATFRFLVTTDKTMQKDLSTFTKWINGTEKGLWRETMKTYRIFSNSAAFRPRNEYSIILCHRFLSLTVTRLSRYFQIWIGSRYSLYVQIIPCNHRLHVREIKWFEIPFWRKIGIEHSSWIFSLTANRCRLARKCPLQDSSWIILWHAARLGAERDVVRLKVNNLPWLISCNFKMVACNWRWHRVHSLLLSLLYFSSASVHCAYWIKNAKCEKFCARSSFSVCVPCRQTIYRKINENYSYFMRRCWCCGKLPSFGVFMCYLHNM